MRKCLRGLRVCGAALITLGLAWCCASCSPTAGGAPSPAGVASARPGRQLWASTLLGACCLAGTVSPDGTTVFVSGFVEDIQDRRLVKTHFETVAYRAATGARLWAGSYQAGGFGHPVAITVSPDGTRVYMTGDTDAPGSDVVTVAYDARTGRQLWASRMPKGDVSGLAVSPDGTTVYLSLERSEFTVIAYATATGRQRWLRYVTGKLGYAASVAVSPDGRTVYATGSVGSSALTVAYGAAGTLKWAARYKDPYGFAAGSQIVAGPGGSARGAVYVAGKAANKNGHFDVATFAYRAATGRFMWLDRHYARIGTGALPAPDIAVTPGGQTVIVTVPLYLGADYAIAAYDAGTGGTRWARRAPYSLGRPSGLVISPRGDTMFIGGNRTTAFSVAAGTVLWTTSYDRSFPVGGIVSGIIGLGGDGTRLFGTRQKRGPGWGITVVAYQT